MGSAGAMHMDRERQTDKQTDRQTDKKAYKCRILMLRMIVGKRNKKNTVHLQQGDSYDSVAVYYESEKGDDVYKTLHAFLESAQDDDQLLGARH